MMDRDRAEEGEKHSLLGGGDDDDDDDGEESDRPVSSGVV